MLDWLKNRLVAIVQWIADLFVGVFTALWDLLTDIFSWCIDKLLGLAVSALSSITFDGLDKYNPENSFTSEMLNIMGLIGAGEASSILVAAFGVRFLLQLIPFTRLGS